MSLGCLTVMRAGGHCLCSQNNFLIRTTDALEISDTRSPIKSLSLIKVVCRWLKMNHPVFLSSAFMVCQPLLLPVPPGYANKNKSDCFPWQHRCLLPKAETVQTTKCGACCTARPKGKMWWVHSRTRASPPACLCGSLKPGTVSKMRSNKNDML